MLSGDTSVARGQDGAFYQMLRRFSLYWTRIDVLCPPASNAEPRCIHENVYIHPSPYRLVWQPYFIARYGRQLMKERDYALVVSHDYGFFLNGLGAFLLNSPYVSEIHHVEGYPRAATRREKVYRLLAWLYIKTLARRAKAIRVVNQKEMPNLLKTWGVPEKKILVLPSQYLDFDVLKPLPDEPKPYDVLFVGRLASNKGILTILEALDLVKDEMPHIQLGIRGEGDLYEAIKAKIVELKLQFNVDFVPRVESPEDLTRLYNQTYMLVCASTSEGGPRVTVEAMACGIPVISTPVGIMPDIIENGVNGWLFEWNVYELAAQILLLLESKRLRQQMGEKGREAVQQFEAQNVIDHYAHAYLELVAHMENH